MSNERRILSSRLTGFTTTIFAEMAALAAGTGAIHLGQGRPDNDGPPDVVEAAVEALRAGVGNQYPPLQGVPELRNAIVAHQLRYYGLTYDPATEVLVTVGATEGIAAALLALVDPGDEVVMLEPYYDSYAACVSMAAGRRVTVTLRPPDFALDTDALRTAITPRTRALLINSPHNPTGTVLSHRELAAIAELACERDLIVITDEVYEHLTFDGVAHVPLATFPGMRERTISISSGAKTFSLTGWKIGWVTGPRELVDAVRSAKQFLTFVAAGPFQYAIAAALEQPAGYFKELAEDLARKRDLLCAGLAEVGFEVYLPKGTYFVTADIRPLGEDDAMAFCRDLPRRCGVVAIPASVFYDDPATGGSLVRFAFCKSEELLRQGIERLSRL